MNHDKFLEAEVARILEARALIEAFSHLGGKSARLALDKAKVWTIDYFREKDNCLKSTLNRLQTLAVQAPVEKPKPDSPVKKSGRPKKKEQSLVHGS